MGQKSFSDEKKIDHVSDLLEKLAWLSAENLALYHTLCLMHKVRRLAEPEELAGGWSLWLRHGMCRAGPPDRTAIFMCPGLGPKWGRGALDVAVLLSTTLCPLT